MPIKPQKLLSALSNAKTRTFVILFGAVIIVGIGIAFMNKSDEASDALAKQGSQATSVPGQIRATPGAVTTEQYKKTQLAENERRAEEALQKKTSAIPTILGAVSDPSIDLNKGKGGDPNLRVGQNAGDLQFQLGQSSEADFLGTTGPFSKSPQEREFEKQQQRLEQERDRMEKQRADQDRELRRQQEAERQQRQMEQDEKAYQESVQRIRDQMGQYAGGAYNDWAKFPRQVYIQGALSGKEVPKDQPTAVTKDGQPLSSTTSTSDTASGKGKAKKTDRRSVIKAGTVLFGILETAVNTDEPGPILATIIGGRFQGSRLLGSLKHDPKAETVTIEFNQMNIPKKLNTIGVSIVAIDPETARTALASDVNHHYLLRYGTLFASSFLAGYGQAVQQQGSTSTTSPLTGAVTTSYPPLDNRQIFLSALSEVGTAWAAATKEYFNTPYTVTVDQGTGIGLLFLTDTDVSEEAS